MMMNAWPFLIGKNKRLDYGVIAAPDFLMGVEGILADTTIGDIIDDGALYREIETEKTGPLTLIYRKYRPIDENNQPLTDRVGRKFKVTEGLVIQGHHDALDIGQDDFDSVTGGLKQMFQQFYEHADKEPSISTESSQLSVSESPMPFCEQEPYSTLISNTVTDDLTSKQIWTEHMSKGHDSSTKNWSSLVGNGLQTAGGAGLFADGVRRIHRAVRSEDAVYQEGQEKSQKSKRWQDGLIGTAEIGAGAILATRGITSLTKNLRSSDSSDISR